MSAARAGRQPGSACPALLVHAPERATDRVDATIALTSRDRCYELLNALNSASKQRGCSLEIIIVDDGSGDGSAQRVSEAFPDVTVYRSSTPQGFPLQRNFLASVARGEVLVSIDDDAAFVDQSTLARTLDDFAAGPEIGAVAIPYRDMEPSGKWVERQHAAGGEIQIVGAFAGTAYAVRRDLFLRLRGFWEFPYGEERDLCARMLQAGYFVRLGTAPALEHRPSAIRSRKEMAFNSRLGDVQFAYVNAPARYLPWHLARTTAGAFFASTESRGRYAGDHLRGYVAGWRQMAHSRRAPLDVEAYKLSLVLHRRGPLPLGQARAAIRSRIERPLSDQLV